MKKPMMYLVAALAAGVLGADAAADGNEPSRTYVPEPRPVKSDVEITAIYYPGTEQMSEWDVIAQTCPERKPLLGWFDEGNPEAIDWQIKWAVEHGITSFCVDWYWNRGYQRLTHWVKGYYKARYRKHLKWFMMYANHNQPGAHSAEDQVAVTKYWIDNYFKTPEYYTIDGKPAVCYWDAGNLDRDFIAEAAAKGEKLAPGEGIRRAFAISERLVKEAGLPGICWIDMWRTTKFDRAYAERRVAQGYSAAIHYGIERAAPKIAPEAMKPGETPRRFDYDAVVAAAPKVWEELSVQETLPYWVILPTGWDDRPRSFANSLVITGRTPEKFAAMCRQAKAFCDRHGKRHVVIMPINEWQEGSYVEPNAEYGFGMYEAIRDAFCEKPSAGWPKSVRPADAGLGPYDYPPSFRSPTPQWEFDDGTTGGWYRQPYGGGELEAKDGCLSFWVNRSRNYNIRQRVVPFDAKRQAKFRVRMRITPNPKQMPVAGKTYELRLKWGTAENPVIGPGLKVDDAQAVASAPVQIDGAWHEYEISLADRPDWTGQVDELWFEACSLIHCRVAIDWMRFESDLADVERNFLRLETEDADKTLAEGRNVAKTLRTDGTWADIDYTDRNGARWSLCYGHLGRIVQIARAWRVKEDAGLEASFHRALGWWLRENPTVGNWWWNDIGVPEKAGVAAVCCKPVLTAAERQGVDALLSRRPISMTGQNRIWLARVALMRALVNGDADLAEQASSAISDEIAFKGVEGIQRDWSFHQHGNQPQFGNYGLSYIRDMTRLASVFAGTRFAFPSEKIGMLNGLFEKGYAWTLWKGRLDVSCIPRQWWPDVLTTKGAAVLSAAAMLGRCGGESARIAADFAAGRGPVGFKAFPSSAMSFYRRPGWMASHKGGTKTIRGVETWIIGDNLKGQHQQDGSLCTTVTGREYENVAPLWNWRKLPGITSCIDLPPSDWNDRLDWTGPNQLEDYRGEATADGGVVTFGVEREGIRYRQRITFAPDGILAETTDISCTNDSRVATCVEAANAAPDAGVVSQTDTETRLRNGAIEYVVYAPKEAVEVFIGERTGDYHDFMAGLAPKTLHTGRIFEVTVNHGRMPKGASCRYRILPHGKAFPENAKWIAYPYERPMGNFAQKVLPAPTFRRAFTLDRPVKNAALRISGLGFYTFELDGRRVDDARLVPAPTQYDVRYRWRTHRLGDLAAGRHVISVTVGDGFYRTSTGNYWHFDRASWTDYPKLAAEVADGEGTPLVKTDDRWTVRFSPIVRTELRGGEHYDARLEFPKLETSGADWRKARLVPAPGGRPEEERFPPCRVVAAYPMAPLVGTNVWVAPYNIAGVPRLKVKGTAGARVTMSCGEFCRRLAKDDKTITTNHVAYGALQRDSYVLRGDSAGETWTPEFTYHGFDRVQVSVEGGAAEILGIDALEIHTDFRRIGTLRTSDGLLQTILDAGMRSALNNFVGIPTDCPHREKNGWTSEARLQCETLLYGWDAGTAYLGFVDEMVDAQRPSGQLPGMLPTGGVGYNWGSGPAWDAALACIPESVARFTGDRTCFERYRGAIRKYCNYVASLLDENGLCAFGLGDWCHSPFGSVAPVPFVTTAFYIRCLDLIGEKDAGDAARAALLKSYYRGKGVFSEAASVMPALALEFGLVPAADRAACAEELARIVRANGAKVDYGTVGSGCVLRALFEAGEADLAYEVMTQPEMPGYAWWFRELQLTAFPESWNALRSSSLDHGAFCDIVACAYRHLAGFRHVAERPGRNYLEIRPSFPKKLSDFSAEHDGYRVAWKRTGEIVDLTIVVPEGAAATYAAPDGTRRSLVSGSHRFSVRR